MMFLASLHHLTFCSRKLVEVELLRLGTFAIKKFIHFHFNFQLTSISENTLIVACSCRVSPNQYLSLSSSLVNLLLEHDTTLIAYFDVFLASPDQRRMKVNVYKVTPAKKRSDTSTHNSSRYTLLP